MHLILKANVVKILDKQKNIKEFFKQSLHFNYYLSK